MGTAAVVRAAIVAAVLSSTACACATKFPRQAPQGQPFPEVTGSSLSGQKFQLPADVLGAPALLLVGYQQNTQVDLDRWLLGLRQAEVAVRVFELPTIPGLLPGLFAGKIDQGMRSGIPSEDWAVVVTIYKDAEKIARFTGNENGLPGRVVLLDAGGRVVFFHDEGYSVSALMRLKESLATLTAVPQP